LNAFFLKFEPQNDPPGTPKSTKNQLKIEFKTQRFFNNILC